MSAWAVVATLGALASAPLPAHATPQAAASEPCTVELEGVDTSDWQRVDGDGFTFCVPSQWNVNGTRARFAGGELEWKTGRAPVPGSTIKPGDPLTLEGVASLAPVRWLNETVDGAPVDIWRQKSRIVDKTGAIWKSPEVYFVGVADGDELAAVQFNVYRTVRFTR